MKLKAKLTEREEEIMQVLWQLESAFVKDIIPLLPQSPKPHFNTVSTMVRNLEEKGYVGYESFGRSHKYYPILKKEDYRKWLMPKMLKNYFDNSYKNLVSFFASEEELSEEELKEILQIIENKKS